MFMHAMQLVIKRFKDFPRFPSENKLTKSERLEICFSNWIDWYSNADWDSFNLFFIWIICYSRFHNQLLIKTFHCEAFPLEHYEKILVFQVKFGNRLEFHNSFVIREWMVGVKSTSQALLAWEDKETEQNSFVYVLHLWRNLLRKNNRFRVLEKKSLLGCI